MPDVSALDFAPRVADMTDPDEPLVPVSDADYGTPPPEPWDWEDA